MAEGETRCYYEVLGVTQEATAAQIKKSYHALALRWHPDKNAGDATATAAFQAVREAYDVLGDVDERAWYDANRDALLAGDAEDEPDADEADAEIDEHRWANRDAWVDASDEPDGFFTVYAKVFAELDAQERTARQGYRRRPEFGGAASGSGAVADFYEAWLGFATSRSEKE